MSFDEQEQSRHGGAPVRFFKFALGTGTIWRLTNGDTPEDVTEGGVGAHSYTPAAVSIDAQQFNQEDDTGNVVVTLPRDHDMALLFRFYAPPATLSLVVRERHRTDGTASTAEQRIRFFGQVLDCTFDGAIAKLNCAPIFNKLKRLVPALVFSPTCNWALFGPGCGLNAETYRESATLTSVAGVTLQSTTFSGHADGYYKNGWIERASGDSRAILDHVGNTITLVAPFTDLTTAEVVSAFPGCNHTQSDCKNKFNNLANNLGWEDIPSRNPFVIGIY